jgi:hypothetical protein
MVQMGLLRYSVILTRRNKAVFFLFVGIELVVLSIMVLHLNHTQTEPISHSMITVGFVQTALGQYNEYVAGWLQSIENNFCK